jgi:hypothetical protein
MVRFARLALAIALLAPCGTASAVIVAQGTGTQNTTDPSPGSGWANVGIVSGSSGVYLGNGWVLTAFHVNTVSPGPGGIDFGGSLGFFASDGNPAIRLKNADNSLTDLQMFHLASDPGLPALSLASSVPATGTSVLMVGNGRNRDANLTYWDVTGTNPNFTWTEDPTPEGGEAAGYKWAAGNTKRWGTNLTEDLGSGPTALTNAGFGNVTVIGTAFDDLANEAQAAANDSGGGVFNASGELVGIMLYISLFEDQPGSTAVFGNRTLAADISTYRGAILAVIPEPSSALLLVGVCGALALRRRCGRGASV